MLSLCQGLDAPLESLNKAIEEAPKAQKVWGVGPRFVPEVGGWGDGLGENGLEPHFWKGNLINGIYFFLYGFLREALNEF